MGGAGMKRIGDTLTLLKTPVEIQDTEFYKRLTIRINHQGVSVRDTEIGAKIGTKSQFRVRAGDFILSKIDARQGAFGIVPPEADGGIITGNFWTYRVDNQLVDTEWFLQFTNSDAFLDLCKRSSTGNTHRKYLNEGIFLNHELAIPSIEEQQRAIVACKAGNKRVEEVQHEITHQQSLLAKLKQAILQEAIQGKLTADWRAAHPDAEPASQLLHRIQAEKSRLIAAKKLRPEKPLPKITPAEIPFEIPEGWEWCRLGKLFHSLQYGTANKCSYDSSKNTAILRIPNVSTGKLTTDDLKFTNLTKDEKEQYSLRKHDVLMIRSNGSRSLVGSAVHFDEEASNYGYAGYLMRLRFPAEIWSPFIVATLASRALRDQIEGPLRTTVGINNVNSTEVSNLKIPLPPLAEQAAIVERVEALMTTCRALEAEIEHARTHAAHLLQAVLKEAFAPAAQVAA
jgi:type I restriction enzyme S subunit